jgi:hypothetical protein
LVIRSRSCAGILPTGNEDILDHWQRCLRPDHAPILS